MVEMIIMCYLSIASVLFCVSVLYCSCVFCYVCVCVLCYVWCMHLLAEVCAHMYVGSCALVCRCQWTSGILSQLLPLLLFLRKDLSLHFKLMMAGWPMRFSDLPVFLSLPPKCWGYRLMSLRLTFLHGCWGSEARSSCLHCRYISS